MNQSEKRNLMLFRVVAFLLLAVLLTMRLASGIPARYASSSPSTPSEVDIALQAISATEKNGDTELNFTYGANTSYTPYSFKVTNTNANGDVVCEVSMRYSIVITLPAPFMDLGVGTKDCFTIKLTRNGAEVPLTTTDNKVFTYTEPEFTFKAGTKEVSPHVYAVSIIYDNTAFDGFTYVDVNNRIDKEKDPTPPNNTLYYLRNIRVDIVSEQID